MQAIKLLIFFFLRHCLGNQNPLPTEGEQKFRFISFHFWITRISHKILIFQFSIEPKVFPGRYISWREKLDLSKPNDPDYVPDCKVECGKKCKDGHKGVSVCGSRFEHADNPLKDPVCLNIE